MNTIGMATQPTNGRSVGEMPQNITAPSVPTVNMGMRLKVAARKNPVGVDEEWFRCFLLSEEGERLTALREFA